MPVTAASWERRVRSRFDFLLEHGFAFDRGAGSSQWYATRVIYRSRSVAVMITYSVEFGRVEVELVRTIDPKELPRLAYVPLEERPFNRTLFDDVVEARAPDRLAEVRAATGLEEEEVERQLDMWATLLRDVAPDLLGGELAVFDDARAVMERRIAHRGRD